MPEIGIIKDFDKLGRIVIPKELRDCYGLFERVEIVPTKDGLLLKSPDYVLIKNKKDSPKRYAFRGIFDCSFSVNKPPAMQVE